MNATFAVTNMAIICGYVFLALAVVPYMGLTRATKLWGAAFFILCAATHFELAFHSFTRTSIGLSDESITLHMIGVHIAQAVSVAGFVRGLYREFAIPRAPRRT